MRSISGRSYPIKDALQFAASENLATSGSFPRSCSQPAWDAEENIRFAL